MNRIPSLPAVSLLLAFSSMPAHGQAEPVRPGHVPKEATWIGGSWIYLYTGTLTWNAARKKCEAMNGQLAVVPDAQTWEQVHKLTGRRDCWLGATDKRKERTWTWIDGTPWVYSNWGKKEPNNYGDSEHYLSTARDHDQWVDVNEDHKDSGGYVCQWKPIDSEDLGRLRARWQEAKDRALQPVNAKYRQELQKLLEQATKASRLEEAVAIKKELDGLEGGSD